MRPSTIQSCFEWVAICAFCGMGWTLILYWMGAVSAPTLRDSCVLLGIILLASIANVLLMEKRRHRWRNPREHAELIKQADRLARSGHQEEIRWPNKSTK